MIVDLCFKDMSIAFFDFPLAVGPKITIKSLDIYNQSSDSLAPMYFLELGPA